LFETVFSGKEPRNSVVSKQKKNLYWFKFLENMESA